jgi:hypothetical protein
MMRSPNGIQIFRTKFYMPLLSFLFVLYEYVTPCHPSWLDLGSVSWWRVRVMKHLLMHMHSAFIFCPFGQYIHPSVSFSHTIRAMSLGWEAKVHVQNNELWKVFRVNCHIVEQNESNCLKQTAVSHFLWNIEPSACSPLYYAPRSITGNFLMFYVIKIIYNKKTKQPTLMEFFTATGKLKKFFWQLDIFDVSRVTRGAHIEHL